MQKLLPDYVSALPQVVTALSTGGWIATVDVVAAGNWTPWSETHGFGTLLFAKLSLLTVEDASDTTLIVITHRLYLLCRRYFLGDPCGHGQHPGWRAHATRPCGNGENTSGGSKARGGGRAIRGRVH